MDNSELLQAISMMLDEKLEPIKADIGIMKNDITELKSDVSILKHDVTELQNNVAELQKNVTELQSEVTALQRDTAMLKEDTRHIIKKQDFMFDEIERVHDILLVHKNDTSKHIA